MYTMVAEGREDEVREYPTYASPRLSIYLRTCLPIYPSIYLSIYLGTRYIYYTVAEGREDEM